jgi:hypothetical protein
VVYDVTSKPPGTIEGSRAHTQFSALIPGMRLNSRILSVTMSLDQAALRLIASGPSYMLEAIHIGAKIEPCP